MKLFELFATLALNTQDFVNGVNKAGKQAQGFASNVQRRMSAATVAIGNLAASGIAKVAGAGVRMVRDSLNVVKEFEQNLGGSEAVFGEWAGNVQSIGQKAFKNLGLSTSDYLATANQMGSLFKGAGYTTGEAMDMTTKAMQRAADVASIMGVDAEWAMESIAGLAKGNFTMMDNLGVAINDTTLANYALEKGIKRSVSAMSTQEKIGLALELFMERTAEYAGNYAKENTTLAGSYEVLGAAYENMLIGQEGATDDFVDALEVAAGATFRNLGEIVPRLGQSMWQGIQRAAPRVKAAFVDLWNNDIPALVTSAANGLIGTINDVFGTNTPTIGSIDLPTWEDIETSFATWWSKIQSNIQNAATWTLQLFQNPSGGAEMIAEAFGAWWTGTAEPAIKSVSKWALNLFGEPIEDDATIAQHVGAWWKKRIEVVENACSWVLQLFGMPTESAETITSTVAGWWKGVADLVVGACDWILSQPEFPSIAEMVIAISNWWKNEVLPALPELAATATVKIRTVYETLRTGLSIAGGQEPTEADLDVISSPTIYRETEGQYGNIPGYATGLPRVPYNNYLARLHEGEAVLNRSDAEEYRQSQSYDGIGRLEAIMETMSEKLDALANMTVVLNGQAVGAAVAPTVSRQIYRETKSKHR